MTIFLIQMALLFGLTSQPATQPATQAASPTRVWMSHWGGPYHRTKDCKTIAGAEVKEVGIEEASATRRACKICYPSGEAEASSGSLTAESEPQISFNLPLNAQEKSALSAGLGRAVAEMRNVTNADRTPTRNRAKVKDQEALGVLCAMAMIQAIHMQLDDCKKTIDRITVQVDKNNDRESRALLEKVTRMRDRCLGALIHYREAEVFSRSLDHKSARRSLALARLIVAGMDGSPLLKKIDSLGARVGGVPELMAMPARPRVGAEGVFLEPVQVLQVIDAKNVIIRIPPGEPNGVRIWIQDCPAKSWTDDMIVMLGGVWRIADTKRYTTAIGGSATILLARPFDLFEHPGTQ